VLSLEHISLTFAAGSPNENQALRNINLQINAGDFITLIGSNGAGKSTLYNAIAGTHQTWGGRMLLETSLEGATPGLERNVRERIVRDITRESESRRARYIGRIFQNPLLGTAGKMTLEDNMVICSRKGWRGLNISLNKARREEFRASLSRLGMGLEKRLGDNVELLSGGQRQALTLLMAVMSRPALLLLDEHTAALDPGNAERVMELTVRFAEEYHLTVMMITHNMAQALAFGNRLLMMDGGEIILDAGAEEKARLTTADIVQRFRDLRKKELDNDEMLLD
jgi:putative ABC transport system ATP-binding protein